MGIPKIVLVIVLIQIINIIGGDPIADLLDDYKYVEETKNSYKIYPSYTSWEDANKTCVSEEASLFYPVDEHESKAVLRFWNLTLLYRWVFVTSNESSPTEELFEDIDAYPIWELYNSWNPAKTNKTSDDKSVLLLLDDDQLTKNFPFLCKKKVKVSAVEIAHSITEKNEVINTKGYTYINNTQSFYKIHTDFKTWKNAKETCIKEGASLFYPKNKCEANVVIAFWNQTQFFRKIYIGISSTTKGTFESIDGQPMREIYNKWRPGEPNNLNDSEGCVVLMRNGTLNDDQCSLSIPFICKKESGDNLGDAVCDKTEIDESQVYNFRKDYTYLENTQSLYKIHTLTHKWKDANKTCADEGARLFYPENECETKTVLKFWKQTQPITSIYIGISKPDKEEFQTIDGRLISEVYSKWRPGEPNNKNKNENCVLLFLDGTFNDERCDLKESFICKKKIESFKTDALCDKPETVLSTVLPTAVKPVTSLQDDYNYLEETKCSYKIHSNYSSWEDANHTCASEDANLFYPVNECEEFALLELWNQRLIFRWVFNTDASSPTKEMFKNIDARPIWELYNSWHPEQSKNKTSEEKKVVLLHNNELSINFPFVCKKSLFSSLSEITCYDQKDKIDLQKDYTYLNATQSSYKIHTTFKTWKDANETCVRDGTGLFYPENECEADAVLELWNKTQFFRRIFIGMFSIPYNQFETVDGRPNWEVYNKWRPDQPDNENREEGCVVFNRDGTLNDVSCGLYMPFVCKKKETHSSEEIAACNKPQPESEKTPINNFRKDYTYLDETQSMYKLHSISKKWLEAKEVCAKEGASLFFPENECEADVVRNFWNQTQRFNEVFVGISSETKGIFQTVDGRSVWDVYFKFGPGEPNNLNNNEHCLKFFRYDGTFNDDRCDITAKFICKKKMDIFKSESICDKSEKSKTPAHDFRKDYTYIEESQSLYKIHTVPQTWLDAKKMCIKEGATLFYAEDSCEANTVLEFWNKTQPFNKVFLGISKPTDGGFETVDGVSMRNVYKKWSPGEPDNAHNNDDCVVLHRNRGTLYDDRCDVTLPYICKKKPASPKGDRICNKAENDIQWTSTDVVQEYTFLTKTQSYYKIHTTLSVWQDAKEICASEGASLFFPEDESEKDVILDFWEQRKTSLPWIFIGVSSPVIPGVFETVDGRPILDVYHKWGRGEPNNADNSEGCVVLRRDGTLNDDHCTKKFAFMCKKTVDTNKQKEPPKAVSDPKMKLFRKDYKFIKEVESFYKIHTISKNWWDAKNTCSAEGAKLFYPENETEMDTVIHYWNQTQPFYNVFVGVSSLLTKDEFETIDGRPSSEIFSNWGPGEPNNANGVEECAVLSRTGHLNDDECSKKFPFICKKILASLEWNDKCNLPDKGYVYNEAEGKCYKLHETPKNWIDAYAVCSAEQSYLAVINSQAEADHLVKMINQAPKKFHGSYLAGTVHLGFHNRDGNGWRSIKGQSLSFTGYSRWAYQQPDGGAQESCGSMFYGGELNDLGCFQKCFFICEHDIDKSI